MCILHIVFCTVCKYVLSICTFFCLFFCTVWSTLIRISLTKALVLWWCDNKSDLICDLIWNICSELFSLVNGTWSMHISPDTSEITFLKKAILWIEDSDFSWKEQSEVKNMLMKLLLTNTQPLFYKKLIVGLETCWLLVHYCDAFINCSDTRSWKTLK